MPVGVTSSAVMDICATVTFGGSGVTGLVRKQTAITAQIRTAARTARRVGLRKESTRLTRSFTPTSPKATGQAARKRRPALQLSRA